MEHVVNHFYLWKRCCLCLDVAAKEKETMIRKLSHISKHNLETIMKQMQPQIAIKLESLI